MNNQLSKADISLSFGRAAETYEQAAVLQRQVGNRLLQQLNASHDSASVALDLGAGSGYFSKRLATHYADTVWGLDISHGMLKQASARIGFGFNNIHWLCGDAEHIPLLDSSADLIFSNFTLQWCENLTLAIAECYRVLKPGGQLLLSIPAKGTLVELEQSWRHVDRYRHVNEFYCEQSITEILKKFFTLPSTHGESRAITSKTEKRYYSDLYDLLRELKMIGAHNLNRDRAKFITGKAAFRSLMEYYELYREKNGLLPASYRMVYGQLEK